MKGDSLEEVCKGVVYKNEIESVHEEFEEYAIFTSHKIFLKH
jgi:hypothetical protein